MSVENSGITSSLYAIAEIAGAEPRMGRPLFPFEISDDEYQAQGSPVVDGQVDMYVSGLTGDDGTGHFKVQEITVAGEGEKVRSFDITEDKVAGVLCGNDETYRRYAGRVALVTWIEQLTGRHDMNIVVC